MGKRYEVREGSLSAHCCFAWTVIDLTRPTRLNQAGVEEYRNDYEIVCECFEEEEARKICDALNRDEEFEPEGIAG